MRLIMPKEVEKEIGIEPLEGSIYQSKVQFIVMETGIKYFN